ncbi:hypothetical protein [Pseudaminobacter sp. NGMCC 1.201702]|uniref:hypothetical protein n=1 Tax=Pseudaminobacter sp. NGMCC 1.201702 TaxID=3391825 RepID=UPI0039F0D86C
MRSAPQKMGPRLKTKSRVRISEEHVTEICELILEWRGPITWDQIVNEAARVYGHKWTRQGLNKYAQIKAAYHDKRVAEKSKLRIPRGDLAAFHLNERVERQAIEIRRLTALISTYEELFIRYQYNAHCRGISPAELETALPPIERRPPA